MKNTLHILPAFTLALLVFACNNNGQKQKKPFAQRDSTITVTTAFNDLFVDSQYVESFIASKQLDTATAANVRSFYNSRNYEFAWFSNGGLNEQGVNFWNLFTSFVHLSKDSVLADKQLAAKMQQVVYEDSSRVSDTAGLKNTELSLTAQFFKYAQTAYEGTLEPADLQWFIPRKKLDVLALLDTVISRKGDTTANWEPLNANYQHLKQALIKYNAFADNGGWQPIPVEAKKAYKPGDSSAVITAVKMRLHASGDYEGSDTSAQYDSSFGVAVKQAQSMFGLKPDGVIGQQLIAALNVPVKDRVAQMLVNLERMRWLPAQILPAKIVVNIPEFVIHVFEGDSAALEMPVVVGAAGHNTVIFSDMLKYIVFSPYWNVPASIVRNEILPGMKRNSNYLRSHNMEQTGTSGGLPEIRQKPGPQNSLGRVKFLFPNNYNIYFHDTPAKDLFSRDSRAFSHGCIRLSNPRKMAQYLLRNDPAWTDEKIDAAMNQTKENWVTLKTPVPVYITYFTAWVDARGNLNFRNDVYGHDKKMAAKMFTGTAL